MQEFPHSPTITLYSYSPAAPAYFSQDSAVIPAPPIPVATLRMRIEYDQSGDSVPFWLEAMLPGQERNANGFGFHLLASSGSVHTAAAIINTLSRAGFGLPKGDLQPQDVEGYEPLYHLARKPDSLGECFDGCRLYVGGDAERAFLSCEYPHLSRGVNVRKPGWTLWFPPARSLLVTASLDFHGFLRLRNEAAAEQDS